MGSAIVAELCTPPAFQTPFAFEGFLADSFRIHLGADAFRFAGGGLEPLMQGAAVLLSYWLILLWMYKRKLFLRV